MQLSVKSLEIVPVSVFIEASKIFVLIFLLKQAALKNVQKIQRMLITAGSESKWPSGRSR
jgi:hypothetical protein